MVYVSGPPHLGCAGTETMLGMYATVRVGPGVGATAPVAAVTTMSATSVMPEARLIREATAFERNVVAGER